MHPTAIKRRSVSAPMLWISEKYPLSTAAKILHFGEGRAYPDTRLLQTYSDVYVYDPYSKYEELRDRFVLDRHYDLGVAIYVFNTLTPIERTPAFNQLINCCDKAIIAVRTDKVKGKSYADGVETKRGTFQTQLNVDQWLCWFNAQRPKSTTLLHNGGHYAMFEVSEMHKVQVQMTFDTADIERVHEFEDVLQTITAYMFDNVDIVWRDDE